MSLLGYSFYRMHGMYQLEKIHPLVRKDSSIFLTCVIKPRFLGLYVFGFSYSGASPHTLQVKVDWS